MAFDFKKEYKEFYMPKNKPQIVDIPKANYIAVRGKGDPIEGFFEYVVPPLEGFWWQEHVKGGWITLINPPFIGFLSFAYLILCQKKTLSGQ